MLNEFTGCSDRTLEKRLAHLTTALAKFDAGPDASGGGSPREGMIDRIEDIETEIERRKLKALAQGPVVEKNY